MNKSTPARRPGFLINRNFALLWSGQAISALGDWVFTTTLVLWVATRLASGQSWTAAAVSGLLLASTLPTLVIGPLAGVFVDRWDKRRTMLCMDLLRALLILALIPATGLLPLPFDAGGQVALAWQLGAIYSAIVLTTSCAQFFSPARLALIGDIVEEPLRPRASALEQATTGLALIVGPPLATPLFFGLGVQWALVANALSFMVSFVAVRAVRSPRAARSVAPGQRGSVLREFASGLHLVINDRVLRTIMVSVVIVMLGAGALNALGVFFVTENLHASATLYGFLSTAAGTGAVVGAVLSVIYANRIGVDRLFWLSLLALGVLVIVFARQTEFAPTLVVLFLFGMPLAGVNVAVDPLLLRVTPRQFVGRVAALVVPAINLASVLSTTVAGVLDSTVLHDFHATVLNVSFGPIDTIFTLTGVLTLAGGLYAMNNLRGPSLPSGEPPFVGPLPAG